MRQSPQTRSNSPRCSRKSGRDGRPMVCWPSAKVSQISQPPAPFHVTPRGFAGPNLLAMILFEKFGQHQPLNRQSERYRREGIDLSVLGNDLQPDRLVTAEDLQRDRVAPHRPTFYGDVFLVPKGETPRLLGQPVALAMDHGADEALMELAALQAELSATASPLLQTLWRLSRQRRAGNVFWPLGGCRRLRWTPRPCRC